MSTSEKMAVDLEAATRNHEEANKLIQQDRLEEALPHLQETLDIRGEYMNIPPYFYKGDIASLHSQIGKTLVLLTRYSQACPHFRKAWSLYCEVFGYADRITEEVRTLWKNALEKSREAAILRCLQSIQAAPAA
jgi:tetratricopeptide (TPR) repeat protein